MTARRWTAEDADEVKALAVQLRGADRMYRNSHLAADMLDVFAARLAHEHDAERGCGEALDALHELVTEIQSTKPAQEAERCSQHPGDPLQLVCVQCFESERTAEANARAVLAEGRLAQEDDWQPIETAPADQHVVFWIVPKDASETYQDTSGNPILARDVAPRLHHGKRGTWGALYTATHWRHLPPAPKRLAQLAGWTAKDRRTP